MRLEFFFIAILCLFMPTQAKAQDTGALISGAYLLELCKRGDDGGEQAEGAHVACQSYIAGLVDYHNLLRSLGTSPTIDFCVPPTTKLKNLQDVVYKYLNENQHHDAFIAAPAVVLGLYENFPCAGK